MHLMYCQLEDISLLATLKLDYKQSFMLCYQLLHKDSQVLSHVSRMQCTGLSYFL